MNKLRAIFSRSFITGALLCAIVMLTWSWLCIYAFDEYGFPTQSRESILDRHPWIVLTITGFIIAVIWGVDHYLKNRKPILAWTSSILLALLLPIPSQLLIEAIFKKSPTELSEEEITTLKREKFGEYGEFLKNAEKITLYSTESIPYQGSEDPETPELFYGYRVFGSIDFDESDQIRAIWSDVQNHIDHREWLSLTMCYNPRHGIRARRGDEVMDYHICFECNRLYVYPNSDPANENFISLAGHTPSGFLNRLLDEAEIEREKPYRE